MRRKKNIGEPTKKEKGKKLRVNIQTGKRSEARNQETNDVNKALMQDFKKAHPAKQEKTSGLATRVDRPPGIRL